MSSVQLRPNDFECMRWMVESGSLTIDVGNVGCIARGYVSHPDRIPIATLKPVWFSTHDFFLVVPDDYQIRCASCRGPTALCEATSVRKAGTADEIHRGLLCPGCAASLGADWNANNRSVFGCSFARVGPRLRFWFHEVRMRVLVHRVLTRWRASVTAGKQRRAAFRVGMLGLDWRRRLTDTDTDSCIPDLPLLVIDLIVRFTLSSKN